MFSSTVVPVNTQLTVSTESEFHWEFLRLTECGDDVQASTPYTDAAGRCGEVRKADLCKCGCPLAVLDDAHSAGSW
jgi:hypothetical protein